MDDTGLMDEPGFLFFWTRVIFLLIIDVFIQLLHIVLVYEDKKSYK